MTTTLNIDIETYSDIDLRKCGLFRYAESKSFEILLFSYAINSGEVKTVDLAQGEHIPEDIVAMLGDPNVIKRAWNAIFEFVCLGRAGYRTDYYAWRDTMAESLYNGYPASLAQASKALGLEEDKAKASGTPLINYFSKPCKPTKTNGQRTRNLPHHDKDKWQLYIDYNKQDVVAEMTIASMLEPLPDREQYLWELDVITNAYGVAIDRELVESAIAMDEKAVSEAVEELKDLTGLENPNSRAQLLSYIEEIGEEMGDLTKATVLETIDSTDNDHLKEILELRQQISKTSTAKYVAMSDVAMESDNRARGIMQYYGANKTGRYTSRLIQVQNLPRNHIRHIEIARQLVKDGNAELLSLFYGKDISVILPQLIRTALVAGEGKTFLVADYASIEARVIAWLAGETWAIEEFKGEGKIYEATASQMFRVPADTIVKGHENYDLRAKGKIATLACGYGGGVGALQAMGGERMGLSELDMQNIINLWRRANKNIVKFWKDLENAFRYVLTSGTTAYIKVGYLKVRKYAKGIAIDLPSGRSLFYPEAEIKSSRRLVFKGIDQTRKTWGDVDTYGGKLVENATQAIARDCLAELLIKLHENGYNVAFHVHDEVIVEHEDKEALAGVLALMREPIEWAPGLVLNAEGFTTDFYMKD